ncbi:MAG: CoA transferase [Acidimicrobiales bacterium]|nr:CoA transferase [Acidimicrobiales bacterium]
MPGVAVSKGALSGITVIDLSTTIASAYTSLLFADFGAEVIQIEPPGGSLLRDQAGWPFWSRGKRSVVLDLKCDKDQRIARDLLLSADVVCESFRPGVAEELGLGYESLSRSNPGLIWTSVTGFGPTSPLAQLRGYEAIVLAKLGALSGRSPTGRSGPVMPSALTATFSAALLATHGTLIALYERESSGLGQRVSSTLLQGFLSHDSWSWMLRTLSQRYPEAFTEHQSFDPPGGVPPNVMMFGLMAGLSKDGRWMQFAHAQPKQFDVFLRAAGLGWTRSDPRWMGAENSPDISTRERFWEMILTAVRELTFEEWQQRFDADPTIFAELFRRGAEILDHPQMIHNGHTLVVDDPELGTIREPGVLVTMSGSPGCGAGPIPSLDEHGPEVRARAHVEPPAAALAATDFPTSAALANVTVIELGTFFAGPFSTALLADLGARVIKIEPLEGDPMRNIMGFPELSAVRVTQGKESIAVDIQTVDGRAIVERLVRDADMVLQTFRGGVARKLGLDHERLMEINPDLIYHYAQGYGIDGPYAGRPAYAPVIAAGSGFVYRNIGSMPDGTDLTLDQVKHWGIRAHGMGVVVGVSVDHFAGLGVAVALSLGLLARARGFGGQHTMTSMLQTTAHMMSDDVIEYAGRPPAPVTDPEFMGMNALYRLYATADSWVVLCGVSNAEWVSLCTVLAATGVHLVDHPSFRTRESRLEHDAELVRVLESSMLKKSAAEWEELFTAADVACVEVDPGPPHAAMDEGGLAHQLGMVATVEHPMFERHYRTTALVNLSRSLEVLKPGCLNGQHTDAVLRGIGFAEAEIARLHASHVVGR